jgi:hypothetical protein
MGNTKNFNTSVTKSGNNTNVNLYGVKDSSFSRASRQSNTPGIGGITGSKLGGSVKEKLDQQEPVANNQRGRSNSKRSGSVKKNTSNGMKEHLPVAKLGDFGDNFDESEMKKTPKAKGSMISRNSKNGDSTVTTKDSTTVFSKNKSGLKNIAKPNVPVPRPSGKDMKAPATQGNKAAQQENPYKPSAKTIPFGQMKRDSLPGDKKGSSLGGMDKKRGREDGRDANGVLISSSNEKHLMSTKDGSIHKDMTSNSTLTTKFGSKSSKTTKNTSENTTKRRITGGPKENISSSNN